MSTIVTGCGRSGTNVVLEMLTGNPIFEPSKNPEDKQVFHRNNRYDLQYLTKCDTCYYNEQDIKITKQWNPAMKFIWCIRDPRDMALSKLYRGRPKAEGGDCSTLADDATYSGLMADISKMVTLYRYVKEKYPDDLMLVRMEDSICKTALITIELCKWLGIEYDIEMMNFPLRMRNKFKVQRYGKSIDHSQVEMYRRWDILYDGWFRDREFSEKTIPEIFEELKPVCEEFHYI